MKDRDKIQLLIDAGLLDKNGEIVPTRASHQSVEEEYPRASDAEKWRLAIAGTLITATELFFNRPATMANAEAFAKKLNRFRASLVGKGPRRDER